MRKLLFLIYFIAVCIASNAQDYCYGCNKDSLLNQLQLKKTPAEKVNILAILLEGYNDGETFSLEHLNSIIEYNRQAKTIDELPYIKMREGVLHYQKAEWEKAVIKFRESVELFDKQKKVMVNLLASIRVLYNKLSRQEERLQYYTQKLAYYQAKGPIENTAPCYHALGGYYSYKNDYNTAINNYLKAAEIYKPFDPPNYVNDIAVVGTVYAAWGNDRKANEYFNVALPLLRQQKDTSNQAYIYNALTQLSLKNARFDEAHKYATLGLKSAAVEPNSYAISLYDMAVVHLFKKDPVLAKPYLERAKKIQDSIQLEFSSTYGVLESDFVFYKYYTLTNELQLAEQSLLAAYKQSTSSKHDKYNLKYLEELSNFYASQNRFDLSRKYIEDYFELSNSMQRTENNFKVAQYEIEQKESEQNKKLNTLQQEHAVQEATIKQRNIILWISLGAILLIIASVVFLYRQLTINKKVLMSLRKTQRQLIMAEKMASLGELTAGVAHEIQNPLNFVNNFSDVSTELVEEMKEELVAGNTDAAMAIAGDLKQNLEKISHHGKRADSIVKGMLQHSRAGSGTKETTDVNALADEYLRLSYHGLRAKEKSFNSSMKTDYDDSIDTIEVIPQDLGRVFLNLFTNAFYSVNEKKKMRGDDFDPTVTLTTKKINDTIEIRIRDNGNGIPQKILDKIYQPFFTTKPTGEGTGLGLSLSYDIITKGHGGHLQVDTKEGEFAEFIITLPMN